jgi:hypothetical protein
MAKEIVTREQLAEMILQKLRRQPECARVNSLGIYGLREKTNNCNWSISSFNAGGGNEGVLQRTLHRIIPRYRAKYDVED